MRWVFPAFLGGPAAVGLLALRVVVGLAFIVHGWEKIQGPFDWMERSGIPGQHEALQAAAAVAEFGGGIALLLGLLTPLASLGIIGVMIGAFTLVHIPFGHTFVAPPGKPSFETAAVYLASGLLFLLAGPGKLSVDALLFGDRPTAPAPRTV
jgi:putative oxidoreductase